MLRVQQARFGFVVRPQPVRRHVDPRGQRRIGRVELARLGHHLLGHPGGRRGEQQQGGHRGQQDPEAPGCAGRRPPLLLAGGAAGVEEGALDRAEIRAMPGEALLGRGEAGAAVQGPGVPGERVPGAGRFGDLAMDTQTVAGVVDPGPQPRPGGDQCLVGQVDRVAVERDQPCAGQSFQYRGRVRGGSGGALRLQFGVVGGATGVLGALTGSDQPQQDAPGDLGLLRGEPAVQLLGGAGEGAVDTACHPVGGQGQGAALAAAPGLQQGVGHQRQSAGFLGDVLDDLRGQRALDDQPGGRGGPDDRRTQLGRSHGAEEEGGVPDRGGERAMLGAAAEEVRPHRDHHPQPALRPHRGHHQVEEGGPLGRIRAQGEEFLELVDHDDRVTGFPARRQRIGVRGRRAWPRGEDPDGRRSAPRRILSAQRGDQPRAQQGGLAAAGRAHHGDHAVGAHALGQLGHELVAPEEQILIAGFEAGQPPVGGVRVVGIRLRCGHVLGRRVPALLPHPGVRAARPHEGQHHGQGRQLVARGRPRQRGDRVVRALRHVPVGQASRVLAQLA